MAANGPKQTLVVIQIQKITYIYKRDSFHIVFGHSLEMKQLLLILLSAPLSLSAIADFTGGLTKLELAEPTEFEGVPCKDEALLYPDGRLEGCRLSRDAKVAGHMFPKGSWPYFDPPGTLNCVFLEHDYEVQGYLLRGESHHYQTCFHTNGWLRFGNLKEPTVIQGVPCEKSTRKIWLSIGPSGIYFHDNGRLKGCRLSRDIHSFKKHKWIEIDRDGNVVNVVYEDDEG